jgi:hypothetical protein
MIGIDSENLSKLQRNRRVWVIRDLLDKPSKQKDILELWYHRGRIQYEQYKKMVDAGMHFEAPDGRRFAEKDDLKIWKPKKFKKGIGISKSAMSKVFKGDYKRHKGLEDDGIVKETIVRKEKGYKLVHDIKTLYKILTEFSNPELPESFRNELKTDLMHSEYAKKLINIDFIEKLGSKLNIQLKEKEKKFILIILKISSSALLHSLKVLNYKEPYKFLASEDIKRIYLMDLQFQAYGDITYPFRIEEKMVFNSPYPLRIEFELKTSLKTKKNEFEQVNTIQRSSPDFINKEELDKQNIEYSNAMEGLTTIREYVEDQIPDLFDESIDKHFDLSDSPLSYEKKLD